MVTVLTVGTAVWVNQDVKAHVPRSHWVLKWRHQPDAPGEEESSAECYW